MKWFATALRKPLFLGGIAPWALVHIALVGGLIAGGYLHWPGDNDAPAASAYHHQATPDATPAFGGTPP